VFCPEQNGGGYCRSCWHVSHAADASHCHPAPAGSIIRNVASATYVPTGYTQTETVSSNAVLASVRAVESLTLTQSQNVTRPSTIVVTLSHLLTNTGNTPSSYTLNFTNDGPGCAADTADLANIRLVRDTNNNGIADPGEPTIALNTPGVLTLEPGAIATLLVQGTTPAALDKIACVTLTATTALQALTATNNDVVTIGSNAALTLTKTASYPGQVISGLTDVSFTIIGNNIGAQDALPTAIAAPGGTPIMLNGAPATLVLVRDLIPAGTRYNANSLQTTAGGAIKLFRLPGDAPYAYRTADGGATAIEVAIGIPGGVVRNGSISMNFTVRVLEEFTGNIVNNAQAYLNDGASSIQDASNTVVIATTPARIGLAKAAGVPTPNFDAKGTPDGTATVLFSLRTKNYGTTALYNVQISDVLEGLGATQFGSYTSQPLPLANQYTLVPGSLAIAGNGGQSTSGIVTVVNPAFTGQASAQSLLAPGAVLPVGGEFTVQFGIRINLTNRSGVLLNQARADSALAPDGAIVASDLSTNGTDPDPDGDGNPGNNSEPTPISTQLPILTLVKTASLPRRLGDGVFEIDFTFKVTNIGVAPAPNLRLIDNLNCTFDMDLTTGHIASWELAGPPVVQDGVLNAAPGFTARANCDRAGITSTNAGASVPFEVLLSMVDGSKSLAPGQSETVRLTVRATEKPQFIGSRTVITNKAWAAAFERNTINIDASMVVAAAATSVQSLLIDPMGTVYNAITRQPITGALVTFTRTTCSASGAGPLTVDQLYGGDALGVYTFNLDGSVSMTTGADGAYQFFLKSPPVTDLCTYVIGVTPPAGSGYVAPSQIVPVTAGTFTNCGAVSPNALSPHDSDPTRHYFNVRAGVNSVNNSVCEAIHNHIPLDPGNVNGLLLRKEGSKSQAEFGDFLDYALTVSNKTGFPLNGFSITDALPLGLAYVKGSARLNNLPTVDPTGGAGPNLLFRYIDLVLPANATAVVRYRVRIGVGAPTEGDAINRARASSGVIQSNLASFKTRISGGVFADDAFAFGKVYLKCKVDGKQDGDGEIGIPGVRLYMENGTNVVTDVEGKWSLYGLKPITHVLRLDPTTLPPGARLDVFDNRNSGTPDSRFLDLKKGEFHKANFIVTNCDDETMVANVMARRAAIAAIPGVEMEAQVRLQLDPEGKPFAIGDSRALPASGQSVGGGSTGTMTPSAVPLIQLPAASAKSSTFVGATSGSLSGTLGLAPSTAAGSLGVSAGSLFNTLTVQGAALQEPRTLPMVAQAVPPPIDLETLITELDNAPGFIGLKDSETVAAQAINVRVKGQPGTSLRLSVNDEVVNERRVGKKVQLPAQKLIAWEYIGVPLKPGVNTLKLDAVDDFGNVRNSHQINITAPDKLGAIQIDLPATARADLRTPVIVKVRLTDANGVPVTARTQVTLESDRGRWLDEDLNPTEPGTQVFMEGGTAEYHLLPPGEPGDARIRVTAGSFIKEVRLSLLPELRPMIGVGIVEGVLDLTKRGGVPLGAMPAGAAFETELTGLASQSDSNRASARSAFFFKGAVKGDYLLTAAYDSDKTQKDRLFRDIRPDEFYPVYGDSAVKGFDAQSTQKLYVRIDKNRSYLLYGDFTTSSSTEVRQLSQTSRSLTGLKQVYDDENVRTTTYVSHTAQTQQIEEFRAVGTSGPYYLSATGGDVVDNSEHIEMVVRDRNQPNVILQRTVVVRYVDYTIEPLTRRILFTRAISSVDANLNPQSIRVTYEVDSGGAKFLVAGTDVQVKVGDHLQLGVVSSIDQSPINRRKLSAVTAIARLGENTTLASELVRTDSDLNGTGQAGRLEMRYQDEKLAAVALASKTDTTFDNPGASAAAGHTEVSARAEYKVDDTTAVRSEAIYSKDAIFAAQQKSATVTLQKKLTDTVVAEVGLRHGQTNAGATAGFDYGQTSTYNGTTGGSVGAGSVTALGATPNQSTLTTVRGRLTTQVPGLAQAQVFVEGEQNIGEADRRALAVGGNYAITDKTRLYGRYEIISSLQGPATLGTATSNNVGIFGVESNYMEGGRVYNEYRLTDTIDGRSAQAALGIRNTVKVTDTIRLTGGVEHTRNLSGYANSGNAGTGYAGGLGESTAIIGGAEYMTERIKTSGIFEARNGSDADTRLFSAGLGYKIDVEWSLLARALLSDSQGKGANEGNARRLTRNQIGMAYRPVDQDVWNALARYEHKSQHIGATGTAAGAANASAFDGSAFNRATVPGTTSTDIISTHLNINPERGNYVTARYAGKISRVDDGFLVSAYWAHLLQARYTRDLNKDWDIGLQAGLLYGKGGGLQRTAGAEIGYQVTKNLWLSGGYNFIGLTDHDLTAGQYTSKGVYIRLRFKFDETGLGFAPAGAAVPVN